MGFLLYESYHLLINFSK